MRLPHKLTVEYIDYNDLGEPEVVSTKPFKCVIIEEKKARKNLNSNTKNTADLIILTSRKNYQPYSDMLTNDKIRFIHDGRAFTPENRFAIREFSGKVKYYRIEMKVDHNAS